MATTPSHNETQRKQMFLGSVVSQYLSAAAAPPAVSVPDVPLRTARDAGLRIPFRDYACVARSLFAERRGVGMGSRSSMGRFAFVLFCVLRSYAKQDDGSLERTFRPEASTRQSGSDGRKYC